MPYLRQVNREPIDAVIDVLAREITLDGEYNYAITCLIHKYISYKGKNYANLNSAIGILDCVKNEFYRKVVVPYEDLKCSKNGDIDIAK